MPRSEARVFTSIWKDPGFLALPPTAQRLYLFLLSQEDLSYCGVIALRPARWARKAAGLTVAEIEADLELLAAEERRMVLIDEDTGELFIRSLIRLDGVWKQPNIMKSARESAALIESAPILAAMLDELLRIDLSDSSSVLVKDLHADFVSYLQNPNGNPSPIPPGNPKPDPSRNPQADPAADPSQGRGDGYGPVVEVAPYPRTPSPRARAHSPAPQPPLLLGLPSTQAEGEDQQSADQDEKPSRASLIAEIRAVREDWSTRSIQRTLDDSAVAERPWPLVCLAALIVARDPSSQHFGRLVHDGPWWPAAAAQLGQRPTGSPARPPWCRECDERTRMTISDRPARCPNCHPLRRAS